jgi:flagellar basal-body rod protein FlgB
MTTENLSLFKAIGAKMEFLSQRQRLISQNISNADTPGYLPQDVKDADFTRTLKSLLPSEKAGKKVRLDITNPLHMPPDGAVALPDQAKQKTVYEVAPVGNAVVIEEQLLSSNKTMSDYALMTSLYQKNIAMMKTALGRGG